MARRDLQARRKIIGASNMASTALLVSLVLLSLGLFGLFKGWQTLSWPKTDAEIVSSALDVREEPRSVPAGDKQHNGNPGPIEKASMTVTYRYTVDGVPFEGSRIEPYDFGFQSAAKMKALNATLQSGMPIAVAYDPRDPTRAYLAPGPSSAASTLTIIGLTLGAMGLWIRRLALR